VDHVSSAFLTDLIRSTIALFVVIDPVGSVPVFIALTQKMERTERASVTKTAIITAAGLLFVFAVAGTQILPSLASPSPASWLLAASAFHCID
jgi:multiple antibiotic resistance protein